MITINDPETERLLRELAARRGQSVDAVVRTAVLAHAAEPAVVPDEAPPARDTAISARDAFRRFGKGRHPAALNFGDCFSYALAVERHESLLFVGDDFSRTNVPAAAY